MKILQIAAIIFASAISAKAGGIIGSWCNNSGCSSSLSVGSYSVNGWNSLTPGFKVNVHTSGITDTVTFYLSDANGVAKSDVVTVVGGASSYALAGGVERHWYLTGPWKLVLTKVVGTVRAEVEQ